MGRQVDGSALSALKLGLVIGVVIATGDLVPMLWGNATWPESRHALWVTVPAPVALVIAIKLVVPWRERRAARRAAEKQAKAMPSPVSDAE